MLSHTRNSTKQQSYYHKQEPQMFHRIQQNKSSSKRAQKGTGAEEVGDEDDSHSPTAYSLQIVYLYHYCYSG